MNVHWKWHRKSSQAIIQSDHKGCNLNKYAKINKEVYDQTSQTKPSSTINFRLQNWRNVNASCGKQIWDGDREKKKSIIIPFESSLSWYSTAFLFFVAFIRLHEKESNFDCFFFSVSCNCTIFPFFVSFYFVMHFVFAISICFMWIHIIFIFVSNKNALHINSTSITCISFCSFFLFSHTEDCRCLCNIRISCLALIAYIT